MNQQKKATKHSLEEIDGLGPDEIKLLKDLYISTPEALAIESAKDISIISGLNSALIQDWIDKAKALIKK
ncbi:MAG: helix-hairpin-helix domain-containing protein [Candidatus Helarchaeota archaeon]